MPVKHLREQLQTLQSEIDNLPVAGEQRDKLHHLVSDIDSELDADSQAALAESGLQERIDELVADFEADHPTVAAVLKDIMVKLASIGV